MRSRDLFSAILLVTVLLSVFLEPVRAQVPDSPEMDDIPMDSGGPGGTLAAHSGSWTSAASAGINRVRHSATLLPTGELLVVGGENGFTEKRAELFNPASGTWRNTGSLTISREFHTALLLNTGRVLVAGGMRLEPGSSVVETGSAELYDPATGSWQLTGSLATGRFLHTATLLPSGKVLVVGGTREPSVPIATAELYDPATGLWTPTGSLALARWDHTATLLPSGKVLIAGGNTGDGVLASSEIYDPNTGVFSISGHLTAGRQRHTATLLQNGQVLVVGGGGASVTWGAPAVSMPTSEIYDPATGLWTFAALLSGGRSRHTATLLPSGQLLVTGGYDSGGGVLDTTEMYDPELGSWADQPEMLQRRVWHTSTLLSSGGVLVLGGSTGTNHLSSAEQFQATSGAFMALGSIGSPRQLPTLNLLANGQALLVGGAMNQTVGSTTELVTLASAMLFDPPTESWLPTGSMQESRMIATATLLASGKILVVGGIHSEFEGQSFASSVLASAELYDPATGIWQPTGSMSTPRYRHTATLLPSGKVLVVGGGNSPSLETAVVQDSAEIYDPETETWSLVAPFGDNGVWRHTATLLPNGKVLVVGGSLGSTLKTCKLYDPVADTWQTAARMEYARQLHTATLLPSGLVLITGGHNGVFVGPSEIYDPQTDSWRITGSLNTPVWDHTTTLLTSGKVLTFGGSNFVGPFSVVYMKAEIFDPATGTWTYTSAPTDYRHDHVATLLASGKVLIAGGDRSIGPLSTSEIYTPENSTVLSRPAISAVSGPLRFDQVFSVSGLGFGNRIEGSSGDSRNSAANHPVVSILEISNGISVPLIPDPRPSLWDNPMTLTFSRLPLLNPGLHFLTVSTEGVVSEARTVTVECSVAILRQPLNQTVPMNTPATFSIEAAGARTFQWFKGGIPIPGATEPIYTTDLVSAADSGSSYEVEVDALCGAHQRSNPATVTIIDNQPPSVDINSPAGGEFWALPELGEEKTEYIRWTMSDNVRICRVEVALIASNDSGATFVPVPGTFWPRIFSAPAGCSHPGLRTSDLTYALPSTPPSGRDGSLYKVRVNVMDSAGQWATAESARPFHIGRPDPTVKTLILWNRARMISQLGLTEAQATEMASTLNDLARATRVRGWVIDLGASTERDVLYEAWDNDRALPSPDPLLANQVLFADEGGIHSLVRSLVSETFRNVEYLILVGDDRIVPFARIQDYTKLFPEVIYTGGGASSGLTPYGTSVGQAIAANQYLSDDPLASAKEIAPADLQREGAFFLPSLAVGRLVESYQDIIGSIASFLSQGGILDLGSVADLTPHKTQITAYDFLADSGTMIRDRWRNLLHGPSPSDPLAPIDAALLGQSWSSTQLLQHLCGNGGPTYKILSLNGHATHFEEGAPSGGLAAEDLLSVNACGVGQELDLSGSLVYSVGCHSGLPVAGSVHALDHPQDLPQTFLDRGVLAYLANTGFGWGMLEGVGLSERMVLLFTEQITGGVAVEAGKAFLESKRRYFYESPRFDAYDLKTSMQWTLFGFPMYQIYAGRANSAQQAPASTPSPRVPFEGTLIENLGPIKVESRMTHGEESLTGNPPYTSVLETTFDFSAEGVFVKREASGAVVTEGLGCPSPNGCYYSLNGLVERASGESDLPIEPYAVHSSLLSGTSQHGVLWMGGTYRQENSWRPVFGRLMSNGEVSQGAEGLPRVILIRPQIPGGGALDQQGNCAAADVDLNNVVLIAGETVWDEGTESYSIHRNYVETSLEYLYFNNTSNGLGNCDRQGPTITARQHNARVTPAGKQVDFVVDAFDADFDTGQRRGIWRVVVVFTDEVVDAEGRGAWIPLELAFDPVTSKWVGTASLPATADHLVYYLQAVDERGNVGWADLVPNEPLPPSGVPLGIPLPIAVDFAGVLVPNAPSLVPLMPDPTAERRPTLVWNEVETAGSYRIQVATDAAFSALLFDRVLGITSFTPSADLPEGHIYWRVSSKNTTGSESGFSAADDFVVDLTAATTPRLDPVLPDPTRERRPLLQWTSGDVTSTSTRIQIALSYSFDPVLLDTVVFGNSFVPPADLPEGRIFWRAASRDAVGNQSPFSSPDDFEIDITPPAIPVLIPLTPDPVATRRPSLSWISDPAAMFSHLQVATDSAFSSLELDIVISASGWTPESELPEGPIYWRVAGRDAVGNESAFSSSDDFEIDVTAIPLVATRVEWISLTQWVVQWRSPIDPAGFLQYELYWAPTIFTDISGMTPKAVISDVSTLNWSDPSPGSQNCYAVVPVDQARNRIKTVNASCGPGGAPIFMDGFESGDTTQWSQTSPGILLVGEDENP